jgi:hypothetical protein
VTGSLTIAWKISPEMSISKSDFRSRVALLSHPFLTADRMAASAPCIVATVHVINDPCTNIRTGEPQDRSTSSGLVPRCGHQALIFPDSCKNYSVKTHLIGSQRVSFDCPC